MERSDDQGGHVQIATRHLEGSLVASRAIRSADAARARVLTAIVLFVSATFCADAVLMARSVLLPTRAHSAGDEIKFVVDSTNSASPRGGHGATLAAPPARIGRTTPGAARQRNATAPGRHDLVGRQIEARVVRVADGDTLEVVPAGESRPVRLRLQGVDAPELGEAFSREATALLRTLLVNERLRVDVRDIDRYGRLVARVTAAGQDASAALVRAGLACHAYVRDDKLAREESHARAVGAGFWANSAKKPGCVTRTAFSASAARGTDPPAADEAGRAAPGPRRGTGGTAPTFRANVSSGLYHAATCPNAMCRNCTRVFSSERDAKAAGFRPAADCLK